MVDDVDTTVIVSGVADNGVEMLRCLDSGLSELSEIAVAEPKLSKTPEPLVGHVRRMNESAANSKKSTPFRSMALACRRSSESKSFTGSSNQGQSSKESLSD